MIEAAGLGIRFESKWVFRDVSFHVKEREAVSLIGPSGQGKSTLLKLISGLVAPSEGSLRIGSSDVGMLFQKNALFDSLSVEENLLFPLRERQGKSGTEAVKAADSLLTSVGLSHAKSLFPSELSGGMQKRLGIARTMILRPEIALFDDPTAGLDPITSRSISELIRDLARTSRCTMISVTNDMNRARELGTRILYLAHSKLLEDGPEKENFMRGVKS